MQFLFLLSTCGLLVVSLQGSLHSTFVIIAMNLKGLNFYTILKYVFLYLFLCMAIKQDIVTISEDVKRKIRRKNIINGPIYTYVKTDKHANIKWGVRHYIPKARK